MPSYQSTRLPRQISYIVLLLLAVRGIASPFEAEHIGSSPQIQDVFLNPPPSECTVSQDGLTADTFPWTHQPTCFQLVQRSDHGSHIDTTQTFCVYTNTAFNNGRGISIVTSLETAADFSAEVWESGRGGTDDGGEEQWERKQTERKGVGVFAKQKTDAGETLMLQSAVLLIHGDVLGSPNHSQRKTLLEKAVAQLPPKTRDLVMNLSRKGGDSVVEDIVNVNAIRAKVWDGTSHHLVIPEAAVSRKPTFHLHFD